MLPQKHSLTYNMLYILPYFTIFFILYLDPAMGALTAKKTGTPTIKFLNKTVNFGTVKQGLDLKYRFHFKNTGNDVLRIKGVHTACGCAVTTLDYEKIYAPDELGYIDITFKTSNFIGPTKKIITIMTNQKLNPNRTLIISANIMAEFIADKPVVDFGTIEFKESMSEIVTFTPVNSFPFKIKNLKYNKEFFTVKSLIGEDNKWQVQITIKPQEKLGLLREEISIYSNSESLKIFNIKVSANITGPIQFSPAYIEFGAITKNKKSKRLLKLNSLKKFDLTSAKVLLHLNGEQIKNGNSLLQWQTHNSDENDKEIEIDLNNSSEQSGSVHGRVVFSTSDPVQKKISINFYAFFL